MKRLLAWLLLVVSFGVCAGTSTQYAAPTSAPLLQQDLINNTNSGQSGRDFGYVFGKRSIVNNALCDLWDGPTCTYVFPAAAQQMAFVSSSASDTLAGTGAQKVHFHYLTTSGAELSEVVSLNGVTPVNTVATDIYRINAMHVTQVGTGTVPAGNISLTNTAGTVTYGYISAGFNSSKQAIYTVPAGRYGYISHWQAGSGTVSGTHFTPVFLQATSHLGTVTPGVFLTVDETSTLNSSTSITLPIPVRLPPLTDVKLSTISDAANANAQVMGSIMGWFE